MTIEQLINVLVTVTLIEMMVATGLGVTLGDLLGVARNWRLVGLAGVANYVIVPAATLGLLFLFDAGPMVAAGFLILAVCPGAPFGPPLAALAKGDVPAAVGLMVILAGSSAVLAPVLLAVLLPLVAGEEPLSVDAAKILITLLVTQLVPLAVGIAIRRFRPALAERLKKPAGLLSKVLNLALIALILVTQFHLLAAIRPLAYVGMVVLLVASWAAGWVLGGSTTEQRRATTLTTSLRNVGVGLIIATGTFAGTPAVTAVTVYGLLGILGTVLLAVFWSRTRATQRAASPEMVMSK